MKMNVRRWLVLVPALLCLATEVAAQMPRVELSAGIHRIIAEVAGTDANRQQGLMNRKSMAEHEGMVFVFPQPARVCMWMRNTFIPLSVAFIDDTGSIINIEDMAPQTETSHCAEKPARFALEMNQGWFAKRGFKAGSKLNGLQRLPAPQ
jgi:uncharacterized protein